MAHVRDGVTHVFPPNPSGHPVVGSVEFFFSPPIGRVFSRQTRVDSVPNDRLLCLAGPYSLTHHFFLSSLELLLQVESIFLRAIEATNSDPLIGFLYGCFLLQGNQPQRAHTIFLSYFEQHPNCVEALACLGSLLSSSPSFFGVIDFFAFVAQVFSCYNTATLPRSSSLHALDCRWISRAF